MGGQLKGCEQHCCKYYYCTAVWKVSHSTKFEGYACYGCCANPAVMIAKIWRGRQQASILRRMDVNIVNHPIEAGLGWAGLGWAGHGLVECCCC